MPDKIIDKYKTIKGTAEGLYKEKGSKFIARAFHMESEEEVKETLESIKKEYHNARHHCFAYKLGVNEVKYRINDDGEPSSTAGKPIYGQILSHELTDILIIVVRYFGGTKLGVGGLINAYKSASKDALANAKIANRFIYDYINLNCSYQILNTCMRIIKENNLNIDNQVFNIDCNIKVKVRKKDTNKILKLFSKIQGVQIETLNICK